MLDGDLDSVTKDTLESFLDSRIPEGLTLDYKADADIGQREKKEEFLKDITSFANSRGGLILIGVNADPVDKAFPAQLSEIIGFNPSPNLDKYLQQLENILRDNLEPRITKYKVKTFQWRNGNIILAISIPKSWNSPHRIGNGFFYARNSIGAYPMSVEEIRKSISAGSTTLELAREYVAKRVGLIQKSRGSLRLDSGRPTTIIHSIPSVAFEPSSLFDLRTQAPRLDTITPLGSSSFSKGFNSDGYIWGGQYAFGGTSVRGNYTQLFRNGIFEGVENKWIEQDIPATGIEQAICQTFREYLHSYELLGLDCPVLMNVTFFNVTNLKIRKEWGYPEPTEVFETVLSDPLFLPEIYLQEPRRIPKALGESVASVSEMGSLLRPTFDALWQAFGYQGSPNFSTGVWKLQPPEY